jgi:hypothetical protein
MQRYSKQCRLLRDSLASTSWPQQTQTGSAIPGSAIGFVDVGQDGVNFLSLDKPGKIMFTRSF